MEIIELIKVIIYGIVEGITEWLPVSSTGHMIILEDFLKLDVSEEFWNVFLVVIQLGAILAVVFKFFKKIFPFEINENKKISVNKNIINLWIKIIVACIPAAVIGILFDDILEKYLYNSIVVAIMLIIFGIGFLIVESKKRTVKVDTVEKLSIKDSLIIGMFQLIAAVFPGTSRSGATILGSLLIGIDRKVATEFTFYLSIPVMLGASVLKVLKFGVGFTLNEVIILLVGMFTAFIVSIFAIKFLIGYVKKHDFKIFGIYRIVLGVFVILYFAVK